MPGDDGEKGEPGEPGSMGLPGKSVCGMEIPNAVVEKLTLITGSPWK